MGHLIYDELWKDETKWGHSNRRETFVHVVNTSALKNIIIIIIIIIISSQLVWGLTALMEENSKKYENYTGERGHGQGH